MLDKWLASPCSKHADISLLSLVDIVSRNATQMLLKQMSGCLFVFFLLAVFYIFFLMVLTLINSYIIKMNGVIMTILSDFPV